MRGLSACGLGLLAAFLAAAPPALQRDGEAYVQTHRQSTAPPVRLRVVSGGAVQVQGGGDASSLTYVLRKRVAARDAREATRQLEAVQVTTRTEGDLLTILVADAPRGAVQTELRVLLPRGTRLVAVGTQGGNIEAYDLDGVVKAESRGGRIRMDRIGGAVWARTSGGEVMLGRVGGAVHCLSGGGTIRVDQVGGESWFETAGGEILVREATGPVHASTAGGSILVRRAAASVEAHTAGGRIDVGEAGGLVIAENSGGPIQVGRASGVRCESAAGGIKLAKVTGAMRASTEMGSILADLTAAQRLLDSFLHTGSGDITVLLPKHLPITVRVRHAASGSGGRIVSDFPEIRVRPVVAGVQSLTAEGRLNGGGPVLVVSATEGTIYLRRR